MTSVFSRTAALSGQRGLFLMAERGDRARCGRRGGGRGSRAHWSTDMLWKRTLRLSGGELLPEDLERRRDLRGGRSCCFLSERSGGGRARMKVWVHQPESKKPAPRQANCRQNRRGSRRHDKQFRPRKRFVGSKAFGQGPASDGLYFKESRGTGTVNGYVKMGIFKARLTNGVASETRGGKSGLLQL